MKIGDWVQTPRFCGVRITAMFQDEEEARRCGYTQSAYYRGDYIILGRPLDMYSMVFAAIPKV